MKRILAAISVAVIAIFFTPVASYAAAPAKHHSHVVTVKAVGRIVIGDGKASLTITHGSRGSQNVLIMHVNLRPSSTPGGGPGTANTAFIVRASDPSPETFSVALPTPQPGWCYVQADARWHGGKATSPKVPIPGSHVCDSPSPSPTPTPTSSVPPSAPHPTPTSTVPTLPKTGSAGVSGTRTVGLLALLSGLGLVVAARLRKPAWARH